MNIRFMKKAVIILCSLALLSITLTAGSSYTSQSGDDKAISPFVGTWDWDKNINGEQDFAVWVGERNDSLLFCMGGVFYGGRKIHMPDFDIDGNFITMVKIAMPKGNFAKSKICDEISSYCEQGNRRYYDISFELLSDTAMRFILNDNKGYWPDTAIMIRRDRINAKFSNEEEMYIYRGE